MSLLALLRLGNETQLTRTHSQGNTVHIRTQDLLFMGEIALCVDLGTYSCKAGFGGLESTSSSRWTPDVILSPVSDNDNALIFELKKDIDQEKKIVDTRKINVERFQEFYYKLLYEINVEPDDTAVLISTPLSSTLFEKQQIASVLFEEFNCKSLYFGNSSVFSAFSRGLTSAIVLDSGHSSTTVTEIHDGLIDHRSTSFFGLAGKDVTRAFGKFCLSELQDNQKLADQYKNGEKGFWLGENIFSTLKNKFSQVSKNVVHDRLKTKNGANSKRYRLPDSTWITFSSPIYEAPEMLFSMPDETIEDTDDKEVSMHYFGNKWWKKSGNIVDMFHDHTLRYNSDLKDPILDVVFAGGNTAIKNFDKKFQFELKRKCEALSDENRAMRYISKIVQPDTKFQPSKYASWAGCSILAGYSPLTPFYVTKEQYMEIGDEIIAARYK